MTEPRVVHINTARTWRGGERQVLNLVRALLDHRVAQILVVVPNSELAQRARAEGLPVVEVPMRGELDLFAPRRIARAAREIGANVIHAHTSGAHGLGLRLLRKLPGSRLIVSRRVDFPVARDFLSRRKYLTPRVSAFIAVSRRVGEVLRECGVPGDRIHVVYSAIDPDRYRDVEDGAVRRLEFGGQPGEVILGNVAALVDHKDHRTLLEAASLLPEPGSQTSVGQMPRWRLFILGEGELRSQLERKSRELGLDQAGRVVFTGFRTDVLSFYRMFDVFVMSSKEEGLGTAVLDALHFGLPVAATRGGGIPEMIDEGSGGYLCPVGDARALAEAIERLIMDPDLRKAMGEYNRARAASFSMEGVLQGTLTVYREVLA